MATQDHECAVGRGETIADVLAHDDGKYWFQKPHLLRLNILLMAPLISSAIFGYDVRVLFTQATALLCQSFALKYIN